jgi:hypothetical protein
VTENRADQHPAEEIVAGGSGARHGWLWLLASLAVASAVHAPSLGLGFVGDDFEWWLAARTAIEQPQLLISAYGGFRPANLWTLVFDQLLYGTEAFGYHLTSILFHLACGIALWRVMLRFHLGRVPSAALACLWLCSPYSLKPAQSLCERFQPMLLLVWLGLLLLWPRQGRPWTRVRIAAVALLSATSVLIKESWVVLPGFVLSFELLVHRVSWVRALRAGAVAAAAVVFYVGVYAIDPPISGSYYEASLAPAAKLAHAWAVFCGLGALDPSSTRFGPAEVAALLMMAALAWWGWRRRCALTGVGMAFYVLPFLPILTVGFLVTRYTAIPLAGFLLVMAAAGRAALELVSPSRRRAVLVLFAAVGVFYFGYGLWWLRGDMVDAERRDEAHRQLLAEARAFAPQLPRDLPILGVRLERESPNRALLAQIEGVPKAYYERANHPYALIKWAPLFSLVLDAEGGPLFERCGVAGDGRYAVVGHRSGGFMLLPAGAGVTRSESAEHWQAQGGVVECFQPLPGR